MSSTSTHITATAVRKAARKLGDDHPAVIDWRRIASGRVARINNADATHRQVGNPRVMEASLEDAKRRVVEAAAE